MHRALAERAAVLEGHPESARSFGRGAADEDWNLARKWIRWHHYHSPDYAPVRSLWRAPSAERVATLVITLDTPLHLDAQTWIRAGQLAHHVQDMASPTHVVPVGHGVDDGFERTVTVSWVTAAEGAEVPEVALGDAQQRLAEETRAALGDPLVCDTGTLPWTAFWEPSSGRFGAYGEVGNRFGAVPGCEEGMRVFGEARLDAALAYTRAVVRAVFTRAR